MVVDAHPGYQETDQPTTHPLAPHTNITGFIFGIHYHVHLACIITDVKSKAQQKDSNWLQRTLEQSLNYGM